MVDVGGERDCGGADGVEEGMGVGWMGWGEVRSVGLGEGC